MERTKDECKYFIVKISSKTANWRVNSFFLRTVSESEPFPWFVVCTVRAWNCSEFVIGSRRFWFWTLPSGGNFPLTRRAKRVREFLPNAFRTKPVRQFCTKRVRNCPCLAPVTLKVIVSVRPHERDSRTVSTTRARKYSKTGTGESFAGQSWASWILQAGAQEKAQRLAAYGRCTLAHACANTRKRTQSGSFLGKLAWHLVPFAFLMHTLSCFHYACSRSLSPSLTGKYREGCDKSCECACRERCALAVQCASPLCVDRSQSIHISTYSYTYHLC